MTTITINGDQNPNNLNDSIVGSANNEDIFAGKGNDTVFGNGGNDFIFGNDGNDSLEGGAGKDILDGGSGTNTLKGGTGDDDYRLISPTDVIVEDATALGGIDIVKLFGSGFQSYTLGANLENLDLTQTFNETNGTGNGLKNEITGNDKVNTLKGLAGDDKLSGHGGDDILEGGDNNDTLIGNNGKDQLTGGQGQDTFLFFTQLEGGDTIKDFNAIDDTIQVSKSGFELGGFAGLQVGTLLAKQFHIGAAADSFDQRFIYNNTTGALFFDKDGKGSASQVLVATLTGAPTISNADIVII